MAVLRTLAISHYRLTGATTIAQTYRDTSRHPLRAGTCSQISFRCGSVSF